MEDERELKLQFVVFLPALPCLALALGYSSWVASEYSTMYLVARRPRRFTAAAAAAAARVPRAYVCVRIGGASGKFQRDCTDLVLARAGGGGW